MIVYLFWMHSFYYTKEETVKMRNRTTRFISLLLALVMVFSLTLTGYAAERTPLPNVPLPSSARMTHMPTRATG